MKNIRLWTPEEQEKERLRVLRSCQLLDTQPEYVFDHLVSLAKDVCQVPIALISLVDEDRQWFKARIGCDFTEGPRETAYCNIAIQQSNVLIVPDTLRNPTFAAMPGYLNGKLIRFYAGAPLVTPDGFALGTLCVSDYMPRELTQTQIQTLKDLARRVVVEVQRRRVVVAMAEQAQQRTTAMHRQFFYRKLGIGFGLIVCLILTSAGVAFWAFNQSRYNDERLRHTLNVLLEVDKVKFSFRTIQLAVRHYALSPNEGLTFSNLQDQRQQMLEHVSRLKTLTQDSTIQRAHLQRLDEVLPDRLKILDQMEIDIQKKDIEAIQKIYLSQELLTLFDQPISILHQIDQHENQLLQARQAKARQGEQINFFILGAILVMSLLLVFLILFLVLKEVRARRRAESAANRHEEYLEVTLSSIGDAVITTDAVGKITLINPVAEVLTGWTTEEALGEDFDRVIHLIEAETQAAHPSPVKSVLEFKTNQNFHKSVNLLQLGQIQIPIDDSCAPIIGLDGRAEGAVMVFRDISEQRNMEEKMQQMLSRAQEINALKTSFISMVSHEFRTPLTTIFSSAELLDSPAVRANPERQRKHFQRIYDAIHRLESMLDDILLIGRAESGKLQFQPTPINLVEIVQGVIDVIQAGIGQKHQIMVDFGTVQDSLFLDAKLVKHILSNLLSNAVKYSPAGSVVEVNLSLADVGVNFEVRDYGRGIPPDDIPNLFHTFQRASNVGNVQGTGLGLNIVKTCVDLHGGSIQVESQLDQGSCFRVWLPSRLPTVWDENDSQPLA